MAAAENTRTPTSKAPTRSRTSASVATDALLLLAKSPGISSTKSDQFNSPVRSFEMPPKESFSSSSFIGSPPSSFPVLMSPGKTKSPTNRAAQPIFSHVRQLHFSSKGDVSGASIPGGKSSGKGNTTVARKGTPVDEFSCASFPEVDLGENCKKNIVGYKDISRCSQSDLSEKDSGKGEGTSQGRNDNHHSSENEENSLSVLEELATNVFTQRSDGSSDETECGMKQECLVIDTVGFKENRGDTEGHGGDLKGYGEDLQGDGAENGGDNEGHGRNLMGYGGDLQGDAAENGGDNEGHGRNLRGYGGDLQGDAAENGGDNEGHGRNLRGYGGDLQGDAADNEGDTEGCARDVSGCERDLHGDAAENGGDTEGCGRDGGGYERDLKGDRAENGGDNEEHGRDLRGCRRDSGCVTIDEVEFRELTETKEERQGETTSVIPRNNQHSSSVHDSFEKDCRIIVVDNEGQGGKDIVVKTEYSWEHYQCPPDDISGDSKECKGMERVKEEPVLLCKVNQKTPVTNTTASAQVPKRKLKKNKKSSGTSKKRKSLPLDLDVDKFLSRLHYIEEKS